MTAADAELVAAAVSSENSWIMAARTRGLWYGRMWSIVRKLIRRVRAAAIPNSPNTFADAENFGKKGCSTTA